MGIILKKVKSNQAILSKPHVIQLHGVKLTNYFLTIVVDGEYIPEVKKAKSPSTNVWLVVTS